MKKNHFALCGLLMSGLLVAACNGTPVSAEPVFEQAWIRAIPPGSKMTAGFGSFRNAGTEPLIITSFSSPSFGDVSLHRTESVDGVSKMREVPELSVEAGGSFILEPGGYHLMLMMPVTPIQPGELVTIEFHSSDGRNFRFEIPVERR